MLVTGAVYVSPFRSELLDWKTRHRSTRLERGWHADPKDPGTISHLVARGVERNLSVDRPGTNASLREVLIAIMIETACTATKNHTMGVTNLAARLAFACRN
jgi:hypothetical protein